MKSYNLKESECTSGKVIVSEWDNNLDLLSWIKEKSSQMDYHWKQYINETYDPDWHGEDCETFDDALKSLEYGNKNYTQDFIRELKNIEYTGEDERITYMDLEGFAYDMGSVVIGEPECCVNMSPPESARIIDIYIGVAFPCGVEAKTIKNRGIAITNLLCTLLARNYMVNLKYILSANYSDKPLCHIINVQNQIINVNELAFYSTPEFFRIIGIGLDSLRLNDNGYEGQCQGVTPKSIKELIIQKNGFFIPSPYDCEDIFPKFETVQKANDWVMNLFNEYVEAGHSTTLIKEKGA